MNNASQKDKEKGNTPGENENKKFSENKETVFEILSYVQGSEADSIVSRSNTIGFKKFVKIRVSVIVVIIPENQVVKPRNNNKKANRKTKHIDDRVVILIGVPFDIVHKSND